MFNPDIINARREQFNIALWFSSLDSMEIKKILDTFEWLKNEDLYFWRLRAMLYIIGHVVYRSRTISFIDNSNQNCLKMPTSWTFNNSQEREITIKIMFCYMLNHIGPL